jgi:hypothetical protein
VHGAAPGRLVDFRRLEDGDWIWATGDHQISDQRQEGHGNAGPFAVPSLVQSEEKAARLVIRVGCASQEEEDQRKEENHEDDHEESAPRGCGQGPEKPDEEKYHWPKQDGEDCGDDPLLCWIVHHVDDGIVHRNSFGCGWSLKLSAPS